MRTPDAVLYKKGEIHRLPAGELIWQVLIGYCDGRDRGVRTVILSTMLRTPATRWQQWMQSCFW
jgi:hypothetical protein